jgi:hypothetical protein
MGVPAIKRFALLLGSVCACAPGVAPAADAIIKVVDCSSGDTIQRQIDRRNPDRELQLMIRGTCTGNVSVDRDDLALIGEGGTVIGTITIPGSRRVLIRNLTVSSPTGPGIFGTDNASFTVEDSDIVRNATEGVSVRSGAHANLRRNRLSENGRAAGPDSGRGINATHNGSVDASDNTIADNRSDGVGIFNGSYARLAQNTIERNGRIAASEGGVQVNRARARANANVIQNNTGLAAIIVTNHADYRTGTGLNAADSPDESTFEKIQHPVGGNLTAVEVSNGSYGDFRQVNITGSIFVGDHSAMAVRGDQVPPNQPCSTLNTAGGFVNVSGRHGLLRLRGVQATPPVITGTTAPFGLRETDGLCP